MGLFDDNSILKSADTEIIENGIISLMEAYNKNLFNRIRSTSMYDMFGEKLSEGDFIASWIPARKQWGFYRVKKICKIIMQCQKAYTNGEQLKFADAYSNIPPETSMKINIDVITKLLKGVNI